MRGDEELLQRIRKWLPLCEVHIAPSDTHGEIVVADRSLSDGRIYRIAERITQARDWPDSVIERFRYAMSRVREAA